MITLNDETLADNMENVWAFSGESPRMMTLNWRMNEMTAAIGLAQLQRVDKIAGEYYNVTLKILDDAIAGCKQWGRNNFPIYVTAGMAR
jgi:dTDP-4-amino-4,6-dideoxygalactose transaminase